MGTTSLRKFLQSLCHNSYWNYAVFWKLQHQNEMLLTWEDGCYDHPKLRESMDSVLDDICFNGSSGSSGWGSSRHDGLSGENPIGQAVAEMESVQYPWGEGVVGEVAYAGDHCWVLCDNISAGEFTSKVVPECPDEWLLQFAAGIKTILLVAVVPHGVLQLGSLEKVAEYPSLVAYIREEFNAYQNGMDSLPFISREFRTRTASSLMPIVMDTLDDSSATTVNQMKYGNPKAFYCVKQTTNKLSTTNQMVPVGLVQDACHTSEKDVGVILNSTRENKINVQSMGLIEVSKPLNQSLNNTESEMIEGSVVGFSSLEEELQPFSYFDNYNVDIFGEHANVTTDSYSDRGMMEQPFVDKDPDNRGHENVNTSFSFPMDCELHKALGTSFMGQNQEYLWDSSLSGKDACSSSSQIFNRDVIRGIEPAIWESNGWFAERDEVEHLLEAVVSSMRGCLNDNSSDKPNDVKLSVTSSRQFTASNDRQTQSEESAFVEEKRVLKSSVTSAFGARGQNAITESPPSSFGSMMSTLIEEQQQKKVYGYLPTRKVSRLSNVSKRRARPGENRRPRPRDRQLIQDRVKELRELVPNGSKCSIDGLLDRTIKHMLFLRSVTDQADKLKQRAHQEVTGRKNMKSSGTKCDRLSGKSWAFELGSDLQVCPVVVEDLEYPGHMLIEMLCNDHGLFLEIADILRRLELTILKGVMETHSNNKWAHFVVEASRGFHRLDIFWPLMQLLQHNQCPISSKI